MSDLKKKSFLYALKRTVPMLIGFFPVGIAYGILMADAGYNALWTGGVSVFVLAGSLQMLMVQFFVTGAPILTVVVASLLLNSRHIFYGISFVEKFRQYGPWRWFLIYALADENYSLLCSYQPIEGVDEKWVHIFSSGLVAAYWIVFSVLGALVGAVIPFNTTGIDFALTAMFVVILVEQLKGSKSNVPALIALVSSACWLMAIGPDSFLLPSLLTTVAAITVMHTPIERREEAGK